jgi:hypothetical protein
VSVGVCVGLFVASSFPSYPSIALLVGVVLVVTCGLLDISGEGLRYIDPFFFFADHEFCGC